jgi:hypothetical protein
MDTLAKLNELHRAYDGGIPAAMLAVAQLGSVEAVALVQAEASTDFYRRMVRGQVDIIRNRRLDGSFYSALMLDLRHYRDCYRAHARHARDLRRIVARQAVPLDVSTAA